MREPSGYKAFNDLLQSRQGCLCSNARHMKKHLVDFKKCLRGGITDKLFCPIDCNGFEYGDGFDQLDKFLEHVCLSTDQCVHFRFICTISCGRAFADNVALEEHLPNCIRLSK